MSKSASKKILTPDFITGFLLGFLVTFYLLFIIIPMVMPDPAVAPSKYSATDY